MNRYEPLVSIITPSYNQAQFITHTIGSVLNQTYKNIEYIVMDGGSTDGTIEILKSYGNKIKWISEKDQGQSDAINNGFKLAKGEILAWLNSDDTYEIDSVQKAVDFFKSNNDYGLVYGRGCIIDENNKKIKEFEATIQPDLYLLIHFWDYILQPTTFFKKNAIEDVGYLNCDLHFCMDWDLWIRLFLTYKVGFIDAFLANSREYAQTKTSSGGLKRLNEITRLMRYYTKQVFPIGILSYIGSTIEMKLSRFKSLIPLGKYISEFLLKVCSEYIGLIHKDGWIGKRYHLAIPNYYKGIKLILNPIMDYRFPFDISIYSKGKQINKTRISEIKDYSIFLPNIENETTVYTIKCRRYLIPNNLDKNNQDKRKLGVMIKEKFFIE